MNQANKLWGESHHDKLYRSKKNTTQQSLHNAQCQPRPSPHMQAHTQTGNSISEPLPLLLDLVCFLLIHFLSGDQRVLLLYWIFWSSLLTFQYWLQFILDWMSHKVRLWWCLLWDIGFSPKKTTFCHCTISTIKPDQL